MNAKRSDRAVHYLRSNFDEVAILATATKVAFEPDLPMSEADLAVMAALRRSSDAYQGATTEQIGAHLHDMDDEQIAGLVSNVKGILHEMEFVRLENEDGDHVYASIFPETNHPGTDVSLLDDTTGETIELQLKATDDAAYVQDWIDAHPDGHIAVTDELASKLDLTTSGLENGELTVRTQDLVDHLVEAEPGSDVWDYFPALTALSIGLVAWALWKRYDRGEISFERFKWTLAAVTGLKAAKLAILTAAMAIPGLNVVTGALLTAYLIGKSGVQLDQVLKRIRPFSRSAAVPAAT